MSPSGLRGLLRLGVLGLAIASCGAAFAPKDDRPGDSQRLLAPPSEAELALGERLLGVLLLRTGAPRAVA